MNQLLPVRLRRRTPVKSKSRASARSLGAESLPGIANWNLPLGFGTN
jgi:hypothetical protein